MPVDPDDIDAIAATLGDIYREAELAVTRQIARHLADHPGAPTAWAQPRADALGSLRRAVEAIQAALQADGSREIRQAIADAYRLGDRTVLAEIPNRWFQRSGIGEAAEAARRYVPQVAAVESLAAAVVRDLGNVVGNILRQAVDAYRNVTAGATARMLAGGVSRREATQAAWAAYQRQGITGFRDRAGRQWRLSAYAEMAVRTASARAAVQGQTDRLESLGVDLVYVSDHGQECPLCRPFEGRVLRRDAGPTGRLVVEHALTGERMTVDVEATLDEARARGLLHPNCRHSVSAYLPGVTRPPRPRNNPKQYEARMRQREIERRIREWKEREAAALTDEERTAARRRVRAWQGEMRDHLQAHPYLKRQRQREQVGAGNIPPASRSGDAGTPIGPDVQPDLLGGPADPIRPTRQTDPAAPVQQPEPAPAPGAGQLALGEYAPEDLRAMTDDELDQHAAEYLRAGDAESLPIRQLLAEMDRREEEERRAAEKRERAAQRRREERERREREQHEQMEQLVAQGVPWEEAVAEVLGLTVEAVRRREFTAAMRAGPDDRRSFQELAREQYRNEIERWFVEAETATNGFMLNAEGTRRGIDPMSLFSGPRSRVERYASEELKQWFDENGRMTFAEFVEAIEQGRGGGPGRDFNR